MTNFFYFDASGQKRGPINDQQLRALAAQGSITPQTPLETDTGHKGQAGQIPGLFATPAPISPFDATSQPAPQSIPVPVANSVNVPIKPLLVGGIAVLALLLIAGIWWVSSSSVKFTAEEQAEIDSFCESFGTNVKAVDEHGNTSFHLAAFKGSIPVAKYLFSKGVNVNASDKNGFTPLHAAVLGNVNTDFIKYLVSKGADPHAKNNAGETPLGLAKNHASVTDKATIEYLTKVSRSHAISGFTRSRCPCKRQYPSNAAA